MEKDIKVKLSKRISLYGKFKGSFKKPLFIIVHGLPGTMDEEFYYSAVLWFQKRGFSTFRFNLYGCQKNARQLMDSTLKTHAADLDAVVDYFRKKGIKKIFIAGHSFGGLTILSSHNQNFDAAAFWDPFYKISFTKKEYGLPGGKYIKAINGYLMRWGINIVIGKKMAEEVDSLKWNFIAKDFEVPFRVIIAGQGLLKTARNYLNGAGVKSDLVIIKGATHYFNDQKGIQEKVFKASERWFKKFM